MPTSSRSSKKKKHSSDITRPLPSTSSSDSMPSSKHSASSASASSSEDEESATVFDDAFVVRRKQSVPDGEEDSRGGSSRTSRSMGKASKSYASDDEEGDGDARSLAELSSYGSGVDLHPHHKKKRGTKKKEYAEESRRESKNRGESSRRRRQKHIDDDEFTSEEASIQSERPSSSRHRNGSSKPQKNSSRSKRGSRSSGGMCSSVSRTFEGINLKTILLCMMGMTFVLKMNKSSSPLFGSSNEVANLASSIKDPATVSPGVRGALVNVEEEEEAHADADADADADEEDDDEAEAEAESIVAADSENEGDQGSESLQAVFAPAAALGDGSAMQQQQQPQQGYDPTQQQQQQQGYDPNQPMQQQEQPMQQQQFDPNQPQQQMQQPGMVQQQQGYPAQDQSQQMQQQGYAAPPQQQLVPGALPQAGFPQQQQQQPGVAQQFADPNAQPGFAMGQQQPAFNQSPLDWQQQQQQQMMMAQQQPMMAQPGQPQFAGQVPQLQQAQFGSALDESQMAPPAVPGAVLPVAAVAAAVPVAAALEAAVATTEEVPVPAPGDDSGILAQLINFKDSWDPYEETDIPMFWHIPKAGGSSIKDAMGGCHRFVQATEFGVTDGHIEDTEVAIVYPAIPGVADTDRSPFVNVDSTTVAGIARAKELGFADAQLAQVVVSPFVFELNEMFTQTAQGRLFSVFRHPIERAVSMFYYIRVADWEPSYKPELQEWTVEQYATSDVVENNWMTRQLSNQLGGELTEENLQHAMQVVQSKFLVGLMSKIEPSMTRFEKFFRWTYHVNPPNQEACRKRLMKGGSNSNKSNKKPLEEGEPAWDLLAQQNNYDLQLYTYIETLFDEQEQFVADLPDEFRKEGGTCCKCDPPTFPPEGFTCPQAVKNAE